MEPDEVSGTKIHKSEVLYSGRVFQLVRENVTLSSGVTTNMDLIRHPGAAAIVPIIDGDTVLMLKQYRHALGEVIWEIPAGTKDPAETFLECAQRELVEETGYAGNAWHKLGEITPVPGYSDECIHIYAATDLNPREQNLDEDEVIHVQKVPLEDTVRMIKEGAIRDGKTISGLYLVNLWLNASKP